MEISSNAIPRQGQVQVHTREFAYLEGCCKVTFTATNLISNLLS
jgi:hypothetical protein